MAAQFLWGAATSAHQVEGNNVRSDWWAWERKTPGIESSGRATDHWHLFREDFALARQLGHSAHRFSLEWARIEPKPGHFNIQAIDHYRDVLSELKRQGLATFITLHHFTNPEWFAARGGWERADAPELFGRYVRMVVQRLGEQVDFWLTVNEPVVYSANAYWRRRWPPGDGPRASLAPLSGPLWAMQTVRVLRHLASAHRLAYRLIHRQWPAARVGLAKHMIAFGPHQSVRNWLFNHLLYALTGRTHDFLGVNYYFSANGGAWQGKRSDIGWPINPAGLTEVLLQLKRYRLPIYITENGVADAADSERADFIRGHVRAIEAAQAQGVDVRGYLHWSLLDNFEWANGFKPRFGLVAVDYQTMKRTIRPSAWAYKAIIEQSRKV